MISGLCCVHKIKRVYNIYTYIRYKSIQNIYVTPPKIYLFRVFVILFPSKDLVCLRGYHIYCGKKGCDGLICAVLVLLYFANVLAPAFKSSLVCTVSLPLACTHITCFYETSLAKLLREKQHAARMYDWSIFHTFKLLV